MSTELIPGPQGGITSPDLPEIARTLADLATDAMIVFDEAGLIRLANHRVEILLGHPVGELLGRPVSSLIPELSEATERSDPSAGPSGRTRDGRRVPLDVRLSPVPGPGGSRLIAARLRPVNPDDGREAWLARLLDSTPDAMIVVAPDGVVEIVNHQAETLFGYPREELVGRPVEVLVPEGLRSGHPTHREAYAHDGVTRPMGAGLQLRARRRDGSEFPVDIALATLPGGAGRGPSVITTVRDVTDRWAAERRLQALLDSAPDATVIVDSSGRIDAVNRQTELLFGWTRAELVGRDVEVLIPERFRAAHPAYRAGYATAPVTRPMGAGLHLRARRRDGSEFPAEISLSALPDVAGGLQVTAAVRDVTRHAELETELRRSIERADAANAAKSEFLSRMSHELRTPLNAVLGFAQILELDELGDEQRDSVEQIVRAGRHLLELINEVLDLSRIESGGLTPTCEPVRLDDLVDEVVGLLQPLAREHQVTLGSRGPGGSRAWIRSDRQRLKQILFNVVSNAVKYNRPGGRADVDWSVDGSGRVCLAVHDTGRGIAPGDLPRLFDPFDRLGAEQTDVEGSGIGLAITRRLVEAMSGDIEVASVPGVGTTVSVRLPPVG